MVSIITTTMALMPFLLSIVSEAHTWIDCIDTDRSKIYDQSVSYIFGGASGNGFCQGYGAGYPGRGDGDIGMAYTYKMLRNEVEAGTPVCESVGGNPYSDWRKRISLASGQTAYFGYLPNGHIVKDKKAIGTQHGVYWTGQVGSSLSSTLDIKPENLLNGHTMNYDDGNCGESVDSNGNPTGRAGDGKPCVGSFDIPAGTAPGIYHMVWFWTFWLDNETSYVDQVQAKGYFGAAYSTCFEVEVTSDGGVVTQTEVAPAVIPAPAPALAPVPPSPLVQGEALPSPPIVGAAAPAAISDAGIAADDSDNDDLPSNYVATVHPAKERSSSSSDSADSASDAGQVKQEKPSAVSTPSSTLASSLRYPGIASATTQDSSANYIKTSEGWLIISVALLLGALV